jgi:hypothetical protein
VAGDSPKTFLFLIFNPLFDQNRPITPLELICQRLAALSSGGEKRRSQGIHLQGVKQPKGVEHPFSDAPGGRLISEGWSQSGRCSITSIRTSAARESPRFAALRSSAEIPHQRQSLW